MKSNAVVGIARFVSLLFTGIFTGFLVAVLVLELSLRDYDRLVYAQVREVELDWFDTLASVTLIPAILATALLLWGVWRDRGRAFWLTVAALVLLVAVFVTTLLVNLPINMDQGDWDVQNPPSDWADVRDEWQTAHVVRVVCALSAFTCLSAVAAVRALDRRRSTAPAAA